MSAHRRQKQVNAIASGHHTRHHEEEKASLEAWLTKIRNESTGNRGPLTAEYRLALSGASASAVTLVTAYGVTLAEIPVVGGFHPHLANELTN